MGKNKLQKFSEMADFPHVFEYPFAVLQEKGWALKGNWKQEIFKNNNPIVLELGCGRGEYTVGLGKLFPSKNFIGVDIKGARMWAGAKESMKAGMTNVAFLRTNIELVDRFFSSGEIDEIWLTFPDPQMKKTNKRLTSTRFIEIYRKILSDKGIIHLKTDSNFMYMYSFEMVKVNHFPVLIHTENLYNSGIADEILSIRTYYEQQWLDRGIPTKYLRFICEPRDKFVEPETEIEYDSYRSYNRSKRGENHQCNIY